MIKEKTNLMKADPFPHIIDERMKISTGTHQIIYSVTEEVLVESFKRELFGYTGKPGLNQSNKEESLLPG